MARLTISLRLEGGLLARVDAEAARLGVKRTAVIERALEAALGASGAPDAGTRGAAPRRRSPQSPVSPRAPVPAMPGVRRASELVKEPVLRPMTPDELRAWKRSMTHPGAKGVA